MGQAIRRAIGRTSSSARTELGARPSPHPPPPQNVSRNPEKVPPMFNDGAVAGRDQVDVSSSEDIPEKKVASNILEERDPEFDAMLQKMVGTIKSKPGGKLEMGEAFIVHKYKRNLPKARSSVEESGGRHDRKPLLPGTLTMAQLQEIMLLQQGRSDEQRGLLMDAQEIASRFGVDAAQVEQILQFISLPQELEEKSSNKSN